MRTVSIQTPRRSQPPVFGFVLSITLILVLTACTSNTSQSQKDIWDILGAISNVLSTVVIAALGVIAGALYRRRELEIARVEAIQKFFDYLLSSKSGRPEEDNSKVQASLLTISTLGDPKIAIQLAELLATQKEGAIYALDRFAASADAKTAQLARTALENIMDKPHFWVTQTSHVLSKARAYKIIDEMTKGKRTYTSAEIHNTFSEACKSAPQTGDDIGLSLDMYRMNSIYHLLSFSERSVNRWYKITHLQTENQIREEFKRLILLFEAIIHINEQNQSPYLHRDYAHLAYSYKDNPIPDWQKTLKYIDLAIRSFENTTEADDKKDKKYQQTLAGYQFNKILCLMSLPDTPITDFEEIASQARDQGYLDELKQELDFTNEILTRKARLMDTHPEIIRIFDPKREN